MVQRKRFFYRPPLFLRTWSFVPVLLLALLAVVLGAQGWHGSALGSLLVAGGLAAWVLRLRGARRADQEGVSRRQYKQAVALQEQGHLDEAYALLRQLPTSAPLLDTLCALGGQYERQRQLRMARRVFRHVLRRNPDHPLAAAGHRRIKDIQHALRALKTSSARPAASAGASALLRPVGPYQPEGILGRGAMGAVYLARDPATGQELALKTLSLGQEFDGEALAEARQRFFREAEAAGRLQHPCIVRIHECGEAQGVAYIAMERLRGQDLSGACVPARLLPIRKVLDIAARVADALDYAHACQVVHRDIKPANIMFDAATDTVKVTDFGIARITDGNKTRTGMVLGTPSFMPPEQLMGQTVDGRSDLYALGVTLFQMLTGTLPLRGQTMAELMQRIVQEPAPDVRELRAQIPPAVANLVARLLAKAPEARYQKGAELARDLRACQAAIPANEGDVPRSDDANSGTSHGPECDFQQTIMEFPTSPGPSSHGRFSDVL